MSRKKTDTNEVPRRSENFYQKLTLGSLQPILDTLVYLRKETKVWVEITNLLIPGENDSDQELHAMTEWISESLGVDVPVHFTAFHPDFRMLQSPPTPARTLTHARSIALSEGLRYVYTGNIHDKESGSTYCHGCGKLLIERDWFELGEYHIKDGKCKFCGMSCAGCFEDKPDGWGARRQTVRI